MPSLTRREQSLVAFVLITFLAGWGIKQWRVTRGVAAFQPVVTSAR